MATPAASSLPALAHGVRLYARLPGRAFLAAGVWESMRHRFVVMLHEGAGREASPTAAIVDTQSVKTTESGGPRGWDAAKRLKARKRQVLAVAAKPKVCADTDGLLLGILVHAADIQDADSLADLLKRTKPLYPWLRALLADSIYNRIAALLACFLFGLTLIIVRRIAGTLGFVVQPRRWVVERSLGWFGRWRRLSKDYEALPRFPKPWSPWPRSASCSTALFIPIAGDCPPYDFANGHSVK